MRDDRTMRMRLAVALLALQGGCVCLPDIDVSAAARVWGRSSHLYPAPLVLHEGETLHTGSIDEQLKAHGYRLVEKAGAPGEFSREKDILSIRAYQGYPGVDDAPRQPLRVVMDGHKVVEVRVATGSKQKRVSLPGPPLAEMRGAPPEHRQPLKFEEYPKHLVDAVLAIEDKRFYEHGGVDYRGVARAILANLTRGRRSQGASTITQQLARNYFLSPEKTFSRKLKEMRYAWALEGKLSKKQILEHYLNEVYLGQSGPVAISGMGQASHAFFSKAPKDLTIDEAALLAGMIQSPNALAPDRHPEKAIKRRNVVLDQMLAQGRINAKEHEKAKETDINLKMDAIEQERRAPYFVDFVSEDLSRRFEDERFHSQGYVVETTLDPRIQAIAEHELKAGLERAQKKTKVKLQGAIVVVEPATGRILAMVGGRNYDESQFNRVVTAQRQPGSVFKPLVILGALQAKGTALGPTSILHDAPVTFNVGPRKWSPVNNDKVFHGDVTLREVIEQSINVPAVKVAMDAGLENIIKTIRSLGIDGTFQPVPSLALGAFEVTPLEVAGAYTAVATNGFLRTPYSVERVLSPDGRVVLRHQAQEARPVTAGQAYMVRDMMRGVLARGTGRSVKHPFVASGKTGTTSDNKDAWFVGFDSDLLAVVWIGADKAQPTGLTGASAALPIWSNTMKAIRDGVPPDEDVQPDAIARELVCGESFEKVAEKCPERVNEVFWRGKEPKRICHLHAGGAENLKETLKSVPRRLESWINDLID